MSRHVTPERIDAVVHGILRQAAKQHGVLLDIQRAWRRLVGNTLAAHTRPVSLRGGRLIVAADRPGDGFALSYQRVRLLEHLRTTTEGRVEELVIRPDEDRPAHG